ncbi:MAG: NAD+ synthase [Acidobacteria bacterium]|jgi:NAD+ synthase (glutamine-hydrolysing)|nr:NAD+ synthase [Acidobacteriota bacterium]MDP7339731.1 NAD+ synthase [Vicinamibacterales bacterium]MDP7480871.1 NAD+ synthase [Vicinamibacterales bacterium]MDP7692903.1 NAD+ synthase [Vicinamibacterales bacterium]HJN46693.1 NAD+ synthase [Vicinamibacterales bacterium]|tara:strand:+ start:1765 stop:3516 length:1752 start_codon:yes stop_codon:yes gene_type:complete
MTSDTRQAARDRTLRVALCQSNLPVGDLAGNLERIQELTARAVEQGADLTVFPELSITGYPPEDLLLNPRFAQAATDAVGELAQSVTDTVVLVGFPALTEDLHNAAAVLANGTVAATYRKHFLPNYAVFDEQRYFARGDDAVVIDLAGVRIGVTICEDLWYPGGPGQWATIAGGAELVVNLSGSPYHRGKGIERERMLGQRAADYCCFVAFCNAVGGQDELVFDGHSLVIDPTGEIVARGAQFEEDLLVVDIDAVGAARRRLHDPRWRQSMETGDSRVRTVKVARASRPGAMIAPTATAPRLEPDAEVYRALTLGTTDYFRKNGFKRAVLGLSGGIDSALALTIAVDALGPDAVTAVSMPSQYTADMNREDGRALAANLGVELLELPIGNLADAYDRALAAPFANSEPNVAEENLQARIRGNLLMALSNKFGWLVLTTGNKSEMSVGYATLYGDMAGGFAILKDVLKTWVYRLSRWRNRETEVIPIRIIEKPPTAELREHQLDTDSLPPYDTLDAILEAYVEDDRSPEEIGHLGFDPGLVGRVVTMVDRAEYKRRQAPPGVRISSRAFGRDRRLPITSGYRAR